MECPDGLEWNSWEFMCDWPENANCSSADKEEGDEENLNDDDTGALEDIIDNVITVPRAKILDVLFSQGKRSQSMG